jgi:hypothetical protein
MSMLETIRLHRAMLKLIDIKQVIETHYHKPMVKMPANQTSDVLTHKRPAMRAFRKRLYRVSR